MNCATKESDNAPQHATKYYVPRHSAQRFTQLSIALRVRIINAHYPARRLETEEPTCQQCECRREPTSSLNNDGLFASCLVCSTKANPSEQE